MKFKAYVIFFLLFGVAADFCLCLVVWKSFSVAWKLALCLPTLATLGCLVLIAAQVRYSDAVRVFSWLIFLFELPKSVLALFSVSGQAMGIVPHVADGIAVGAATAVALFFATLIFFVSQHLQVNELHLSFRNLPARFDGLRICQLTDIHLGSYGRTSPYVKRIIRTTCKLAPDLILFTGDLVNFETDEAVPYRDEFARLTAPLGIFSIRGNHDYLLHGHHDEQERLSDMERLSALETGLGWRLLGNAHALLRRGDDTLAVVGVDNISANPFFNKAGGDFALAMKGLPRELFKILLSHDPSHWRKEVVPEGSVALTLSGHTHGLRYKLAGRHISHWYLPESAGTYREKEQVLHVSKGLGSAFAFRMGGFPSIDLITLHRNYT